MIWLAVLYFLIGVAVIAILNRCVSDQWRLDASSEGDRLGSVLAVMLWPLVISLVIIWWIGELVLWAVGAKHE